MFYSSADIKGTMQGFPPLAALWSNDFTSFDCFDTTIFNVTANESVLPHFDF